MQRLAVLSTQEINVLLALFHSADVIVEGGKLSYVVSGVPAGQDSEFISVLVVFDHAQLDVLAEILPELVESVYFLLVGWGETNVLLFLLFSLVFEQIFFIFWLWIETDQHINCLAQQFLGNLSQNFLLLDVLSINVQWQVIWIDDGLDEVQVLG